MAVVTTSGTGAITFSEVGAMVYRNVPTDGTGAITFSAAVALSRVHQLATSANPEYPLYLFVANDDVAGVRGRYRRNDVATYIPNVASGAVWTNETSGFVIREEGGVAHAWVIADGVTVIFEDQDAEELPMGSIYEPVGGGDSIGVIVAEPDIATLIGMVEFSTAPVSLTFTVAGDLTAVFPLAGIGSLVFTADVTLSLQGESVCVKGVVDEILLLWGIEAITLAPDFIRQQAINILNASLQFIYSQANGTLDFLSRARRKYTLAPASDTDDLPDGYGDAENTYLANQQTLAFCHLLEMESDVQGVRGVRLSPDAGDKLNSLTGIPLRPVGSMSQLENSGQYYTDAESEPTASPPRFFHVERTFRDNVDSTRVRLHFRPVSASTIKILADVTLDAPRFAWPDYCACSRIPIPHRYIESLLLPVARYRGQHSIYTPRGRENAASIDAEYKAALAEFGLVDPQPEVAKK